MLTKAVATIRKGVSTMSRLANRAARQRACLPACAITQASGFDKKKRKILVQRQPTKQLRAIRLPSACLAIPGFDRVAGLSNRHLYLLFVFSC